MPPNKTIVFICGLAVGAAAGIYVWDTFFPRPTLFDRTASLSVRLIEHFGLLKAIAKGENQCAATVIAALLKSDLDESSLPPLDANATATEKGMREKFEAQVSEAKAFFVANPNLSTNNCGIRESNQSIQSGPAKSAGR